MDVEEVRARVQAIRAAVLSGDDEAADSLTASLHSDVLYAIADDTDLEMSPTYVRQLAWLAYAVRDIS